MGATYTRQSTYADGDTITAAHTNDEFDQLLAAFAASTGHTHDGTAGEGGPLSTLLGHALTFGAGTTGTDIIITFDGESSDGVLKWMEDEDYFEFSDDILMATTEKLQFRDTAIYINSSADGQLDLVADTEIQIAATTIDINGLVDISGNLSVGGNLDVTGTFDLSDANFTNAGDIQLDSISGDSDTNTSIAFSGSDVITVTTGGETQITFNNGSIAPTTDSDVDLGTSSLYFKDAYIDSVTTTGNISVGGNLDVTGSFDMSDANITNVGSIQLDSISGDGDTDTNIEFSGSDVITVTTGGETQITFNNGSILPTTDNDVDLGSSSLEFKDIYIDGTAYLDAINFNGTAISATAAELNILDANNSTLTNLTAISAVAADDVFLAIDTSDSGILKKITRSAIVSGLAAGELSNVVEDTSPQLGGNLDLNGADIVTTSNADLELAPNGTGLVKVKGNDNAGSIKLMCTANTHGQTIKTHPHNDSVTNTMLLPTGANSTLVSLVSTDTLTNKTLTSPVINTGTFGTSILPVSADGTTLGSASKEFSDLFLADGAVVSFGNDQEITLTHIADEGLILKHVGTGDGKEPSFSFHAGDNDIAQDDVLGSIFFRAPDEGAGTDAILVAAGIEAVAEGDFSASNNATKLVFKTAASEVASEKMSLSSAGLLTIADDFVIKDGGTIGVSSTVDAMTISSAGIVTFKDDILIKDGGTIGVASTADAITISSAGLVTIKDDIVLKSGGTIGGANDTDLLTIGNGILTVAGEVSLTTLDIGGTNVTSTAAELNILDGVTATTAELNYSDGVTSAIQTQLNSRATKGFAIAMAIVFG